MTRTTQTETLGQYAKRWLPQRRVKGEPLRVSTVVDYERALRLYINPGGATEGSPKTDAGIRDVAVPPHLYDTVRDHLNDYVQPARDSLLFPSDSGGYLHESVVYRRWNAARRAAGRPDLRIHDLRHTGATLAAQAGATTAELQHVWATPHLTPR